MGAKMAPFAGYDMPIQYSSISAEHLAVREAAGMFDVSHMGEFWIRGAQALDFLQYLTPNDVSKLKVGRAQYSMLPNAQGGLVDDIYIYRTGEQEYLMVVNAANIDKDWTHVQALAGSFDVDLENASENWALIAVQGPKAAEKLQTLCDTDLSATRKNDTFVAKVAGKAARLARTGYTGEDGFEVFVAPGDAEAVWKALLEVGVIPCGLGARDTLRLEAGFPLYGHEFTDETSPLCTPFAWVVKTHKEFHGKAAMLSRPCHRRLVGLVLEQGIPREGYKVFAEGREVGQVTSGTLSPLSKKGIAMAYIEAAYEGLDTPLQVEIRGKLYAGKVSKLPFAPLG
ncbi:Aminomethyltransferase [Calidithermus roseus]|uniref:Aminomethyltransferase n=2 Tax=Calidithermus roseus TaxID=1644118 RepID=A0A399EKA0_9DEIN|nr:Aminomethyltransferase [Calidithermus roseus]